MSLNYIEQSGVILTPSPYCSLCNKNVNTNTCHIKTGCEHFFHKNCFDKYIENNSNCPICDVALTSYSGKNNPNRQMITRQQKRNQNANLETETLQSEQTVTVGITHDEESRINRLVTAAVTTQQTRLLSELKQQMTTLIQSSLETTFRNFTAQNPSISTPTFETSHNITHLPPIQENVQTVDELLGINSLNTNVPEFFPDSVHLENILAEIWESNKFDRHHTKPQIRTTSRHTFNVKRLNSKGHRQVLKICHGKATRPKASEHIRQSLRNILNSLALKIIVIHKEKSFNSESTNFMTKMEFGITISRDQLLARGYSEVEAISVKMDRRYKKEVVGENDNTIGLAYQTKYADPNVSPNMGTDDEHSTT
uniref:RING-type domain-containing protein n=1 Tax=Glossina austeni TaxID=7395 RepID=A0A1A9V130_GLOAU